MFKKILFSASVVAVALFGVITYRQSLEKPGPFDQTEISHPSIDQIALEKRLSLVPRDQLLKMQQAGREIKEWEKLLGKIDKNVLEEFLKDEPNIYPFNHYPNQDVYDNESFSQYYYHSHRENEHGHFHVFQREEGIPIEIEPLYSKSENAFSHLVAIGMHPDGKPLTLFLTNQWVTGENWYKGSDVCSILDNFKIEHPFPSWPVNQWLNAMLRLFKPQIEDLHLEKDHIVSERNIPLEELFEDKNTEVLVSIPISIDSQLATINRLLNQS